MKLYLTKELALSDTSVEVGSIVCVGYLNIHSVHKKTANGLQFIWHRNYWK